MKVPFDFGYPINFGDPHFALYQPVNDCFMLTVCDQSHAMKIKLLASARYSLFVIDLTTAENYAANVVDNECCHNWTLSNKSHIGIGAANIPQIVASQSLLETLTTESNIESEKQYLQTVWHFIKYLEEVELRANKHIHDWIEEVLDANIYDPDYQQMKNFMAKIMRKLYLCDDLEHLQSEIQQIQFQLEKLLPPR